MSCESTHLVLVLTSCLANSSNFSFWCSPKPSSNIKLPLQLVPPAPPPHQVSNSIPVSRESFAQSYFLLRHSLSNLSIAMFQIYYHSLFSFNIIHYPSAPLLLDLLGLYHPPELKFLCFSVISSQRPFPILSTRWVIAFILTVSSLFCHPLQMQGHPKHLLELACTPHPLPLLLLWCCVNISGRDPHVRQNSSAINWVFFLPPAPYVRSSAQEMGTA